MLAMDAHRHPRRPGGQLHLQRGQVAAVHNLRAQLAEYLEQLGVLPKALPRRLVQRDEFNVAALNAILEISHLGQRQHRVPVGIGAACG